jgi:hypothetical protein
MVWRSELQILISAHLLPKAIGKTCHACMGNDIIRQLIDFDLDGLYCVYRLITSRTSFTQNDLVKIIYKVIHWVKE